jgi:hypothetical protein
MEIPFEQKESVDFALKIKKTGFAEPRTDRALPTMPLEAPLTHLFQLLISN